MKKTEFERLVFTWICPIVFGAGLLLSGNVRGAVAVTVSPAIVTNDFVGKISIAVTGLTAGQTIRVEKYSDLNANGVVNEAEYVMRSFTVTDGQMPLLAGCTNLNVPGDEDALANGQTRTELLFPGVDSVLDRIAAKYLVRVSDPLGSFTPITNSFEVRQRVYPQGVMGKVVDGGTGLPLTNAVVVAVFQKQPGGFAAVADADGNYTLYSPPGNYVLIVIQSGYVTNPNEGLVSVSSDAFAVKNLTNNTAPWTVSGQLRDSVGGTGLAGMFIEANSSSGSFTGTFTDPNGYYNLKVTPGEWRFGPNESQLAQVGYLRLSSKAVTNVSSDVSNLNFPVTKVTALIYGRITDNFMNPVVGIEFRANDYNTNSFEARGRSFPADGSYALGVKAGTWWVRAEEDELSQLGLSTSDTLVTVTNGQALRVDFTAFRLQVTSLFLPSGTEGSLYSAQLTATYGQPPYTWSLAPGSNPLPEGLALSANGVISGVASSAGMSSIVARVTDTSAFIADQPLTVVVLPRDTGTPPMQWDDRFVPNGVNGPVYAIAVSGNNVYVGGAFSIAGGVVANNIAVWNGRSWSALGSGVDGQVNAIFVNGAEVYVGGQFINAGGASAPGIATWNGSSWSGLGGGMNGSVYALAVTGDGRLFAAGSFTMAGGVSASRIAQWNGTGWSALGDGVNDTALALVASGTDLYAGGAFTTAGGSTASHVAKWSGAVWSALGNGCNGNVLALAATGTDVYAGGAFTSAGSVNAMNIAKWNGGNWDALGSGVGDTNSSVSAILAVGTNLHVGGRFSSVGGLSSTNTAIWNGSIWLPSGSGMGNESSSVQAIAAGLAEGYVGGTFTTASEAPANHIARFTPGGWTVLGEGLGGAYGSSAAANAIAVSGEDVYVGGGFFGAGSASGRYVARWDGNSWWDVGRGFDGPVYALAVAGTDLYAGGAFYWSYTGDYVWYIARWNGTTWLNLGSGLNLPVRAIAVSGTDVYAGGDFTTAGGASANHVARWNGSSWFPLGSGMNGTVRAIAVTGSEAYVGGDFTTAGGLFANHIARWNGTGWAPLGDGVNGSVHAIAVRGSIVYVGGSFTTAGSTTADNIAQWNGSEWSALGSGVDNGVYALALNDTELFVGGGFSHAGGNIASGIARWDGSRWHALGGGVAGIVGALAVNGNDLYSGGNFIFADGRPSQGFAHWVIPPRSPFLSDSVRLSPSEFQFLLNGLAGQNYTIQVSTNLGATGWQSILTTNSLTGSFIVVDGHATNRLRFYRALQSP